MSSSDRVKFIRTNILKLSVQKFGDALGFSRSYVADIEAERTEPSYRFVKALREVYNVNLNWIVTGEGGAFLDSNNQNTASNNENHQIARNDLINQIESALKKLKEVERMMSIIKAKEQDLSRGVR